MGVRKGLPPQQGVQIWDLRSMRGGGGHILKKVAP